LEEDGLEEGVAELAGEAAEAAEAVGALEEGGNAALFVKRGEGDELFICIVPI